MIHSTQMKKVEQRIWITSSIEKLIGSLREERVLRIIRTYSVVRNSEWLEVYSE